jgi:two-component system, sensor histidine kinase
MIVEEQQGQTQTPKSRGPPSVLLVDDSMSILKMTSKTLQRDGFNVTTAENGSIALNILKERAKDFEVVLMDLQMPVMDGLETTRRFRAHELADVLNEQSGAPVRRLPIIGMSANSDDETRRQALEVGMDNFIPKPFNIDKFHELFSRDT